MPWTVVVVNAWTAEWIHLSPSTTSRIEPPRSGHVAWTTHDGPEAEEAVYVFGGYAEENPQTRYPINDLWKFGKTGWKLAKEASSASSSSSTSSSSKDEYTPQERLAAAAATLHNTPVILGGWDSQQAGTGGVILSDITQYDPELNKFTKLSMELEQQTSQHVAVALTDESTILLHTHRCVDHVLLWKQPTKKDAPIMVKQPTTGTPPSPR